MSVHTKAHPTKSKNITITFVIPGSGRESYAIPNTPSVHKKIEEFQETLTQFSQDITPWEEATPWNDLAKDRIAKYTKAGLALRGARFRQGMSQKTLAKKSKVSQENISRMENGKRVIGKDVAKRLAKVLHIDYHLLTA